MTGLKRGYIDVTMAFPAAAAAHVPAAHPPTWEHRHMTGLKRGYIDVTMAFPAAAAAHVPACHPPK
jgi:hypothetical protein